MFSMQWPTASCSSTRRSDATMEARRWKEHRRRVRITSDTSSVDRGGASRLRAARSAIVRRSPPPGEHRQEGPRRPQHSEDAGRNSAARRGGSNPQTALPSTGTVAMLALGASSGAAGGLAQRLVESGGKSAGRSAMSSSMRRSGQPLPASCAWRAWRCAMLRCGRPSPTGACWIKRRRFGAFRELGRTAGARGAVGR